MLWKQGRGGGSHGFHGRVLMLLGSTTALILLFSQTATVLLNTDLDLARLHGYVVSESVPFGFRYNCTSSSNIPSAYIQRHSTMWSRRASTFPTFAEYSTRPVEQDGVSDTGATLRAFLPYSSQQTRQTIQSYTGPATVVDTRVTCQVPDIRHATVRVPFDSRLMLVVEGEISSTRQTPRLMNDSFQWPTPMTTDATPIIGLPIPIACTVVTGNSDPSVQNPPPAPGWRSSLCQLAEGGSSNTMFAGGLVSEFQSQAPMNMSDLSVSEASYSWGVAYLALNVTRGVPYHWDAVLGDQGDSSNGFYPPAYQDRGEWRDFIFDKGKLVLSTALCYASFMTADILVEIHSSANRSEPSAAFDFQSKTYTFPEVREQLGQNTSQSQTDRGVLSLKPQRSSWLAESRDELPQKEPYIRDFANLHGPLQVGNDGNYTAILWDQGSSSSSLSDVGSAAYLYPDPFKISFYQDIVGTGGSVAFALQSLYTVLSGIAYYDQLPQFDNADTTHRTDFVTVNMPVRWREYVAVAAVAALHLR